MASFHCCCWCCCCCCCCCCWRWNRRRTSSIEAGKVDEGRRAAAACGGGGGGEAMDGKGAAPSSTLLLVRRCRRSGAPSSGEGATTPIIILLSDSPLSTSTCPSTSIAVAMARVVLGRGDSGREERRVRIESDQLRRRFCCFLFLWYGEGSMASGEGKSAARQCWGRARAAAMALGSSVARMRRSRAAACGARHVRRRKRASWVWDRGGVWIGNEGRKEGDEKGRLVGFGDQARAWLTGTHSTAPVSALARSRGAAPPAANGNPGAMPPPRPGAWPPRVAAPRAGPGWPGGRRCGRCPCSRHDAAGP